MLRKILFVLFIIANSIHSQDNIPTAWYMYEKANYDIYFTSDDSSNIPSLLAYFDNSHSLIENYKNNKFLTKFDVYIHPNRKSLDLEWSANWDMPGFRSECWMVGSGVADQFDFLSPRIWPEQACDHDPNDMEEIQKLITHELFHVYHGQINLNHFFENMEEMAWLIEGAAVLISGQLDNERMKDVKKLVNEDRYPRDLMMFWEGRSRYGLSGSLVKYIEDSYGKDKLFELLKTQTNEELLKSLKLSEDELIKNWASDMLKN